MATYTPGGGADAWGRMPGDPLYGISPGSPTAGGTGGTAPATTSPNQPIAWTESGSTGVDPTTGLPIGPYGTTTPPAVPGTPTPAPGTDPSKATTTGAASTAPMSDRDRVIQWAQQNNRPDIANNPDYWADQVTRTGGGANTGNWGYWTNRMAGTDSSGNEPGKTVSDFASTAPALTTPTTASTDSAPSAASTIASQVGSTVTGSDDLMSILKQRATQGLNINKNDPIIRQQTDAYSAQQQQAERNALSAMAEKAGPSGNIGAETRAANEQVAQNTSAFTGQLMQNELQARRDEIQNALTQWQGLLTDEQKMDLERQLAEMDNALQYARLSEQKDEFGQSLAERGYEFDTNYQAGILGS